MCIAGYERRESATPVRSASPRLRVKILVSLFALVCGRPIRLRRSEFRIPSSEFLNSHSVASNALATLLLAAEKFAGVPSTLSR
jgi:hypothetical protein